MMRIILVIILSLQAAALSAQTCHTEPVKIGFAKAGIVSFENEVSYAELAKMTNSSSKWPVIRITMANFDTQPGFFGLETGSLDNEIVLSLTFSGKPVGWDEEMPEIPTGEYVMKSSQDIEGSVDFSINKGGKTQQGIFPAFANMEGSAELLEIGADFVCFRVNLKDKVKGDYVSMAGKIRLVNSLK